MAAKAVLVVVAALLLALALAALTGCRATPFSSEGIARALEAAGPALRQLNCEGSAIDEGGDVTVIVLMPNLGRPWWQMPFTISDLGNKTYVIVVPSGRMP